MTKQEFAVWVAACKSYYPKEKNLLDTEAAVSAWYEMLSDLDFDVASQSLRACVSTSTFSPSIAEIRRQARELQCDDVPNWGEAWEEVVHAIRNYGSYREKEAYEHMSELTRRTVQCIGFRDICMSENVSIERGQFRSVYDQLARRERERKQMSPTLIAEIDRLKLNLSVKSIDNDKLLDD